MEVVGPIFGSSRVFVDVNEDGLATMRFSGVFGSRFTMRGNFELLEDSRIFQGVARYWLSGEVVKWWSGESGERWSGEVVKGEVVKWWSGEVVKGEIEEKIGEIYGIWDDLAS